MEFDSIISFLFLLALFVLPGILKKFKAAKAKMAVPEQDKKKPSWFDKIQKFVREIEQHANQQKQTEDKSTSLWNDISESKTESEEVESFNQKNDYFTESEISETIIPEDEISGPIIPEDEIQTHHAVIKESERHTAKKAIKESIIEEYPVIFKSNSLQNAIIWSEILGKPVGLRK